MSTITIKKTITEHHPEKRYNEETGKWEARCTHQPPHGVEMDSAIGRGRPKIFRKDWHEVETPVTVPYAERQAAGIRGGTIRREITVEGDWSGKFNVGQVDTIVRSLISNYNFSSPDMMGLDRNQQREALAHQMHIERILIMLGATVDSIKELD